MKSNSERIRAIRRVLIIELVLNLLVAGAKAVYGTWSGSLAIFSDAIHSLADGSSNIVGLVVIHFASAPPDANHPYGHRKLEIVAAAGIGIAITIATLRFAWSALSALLYGATPPQTSLTGFVIIGVTLCINIGVAIWEARQARLLASAYLAADAAHTASDILVTAAVMISFAAAHLGIAWADPLGALFVVFVIARVAWKILTENISILIDKVAVDTRQVERIASSVPGVHSCHKVRSRGIADAVHVDLHLLIDGSMPLRQAHDLAHRVEDALRQHLPTITDVTIHMEPDDEPVEGL